MNIFILAVDPRRAAALLLPQHLGLFPGRRPGSPKMAVEAMQMIASAYYAWGWEPIHRVDGGEYSPYSHPYHRCTRWVREDPCHAWWTLRHAWAICERYHELTDTPSPVHDTVREAIRIFLRNRRSPADRLPPRHYVVAVGISSPVPVAPSRAVVLYTAYYDQKIAKFGVAK